MPMPPLLACPPPTEPRETRFRVQLPAFTAPDPSPPPSPEPLHDFLVANPRADLVARASRP